MSAYEDMQRYYQAIGEFVTIFSEVELRLLKVLWHFSGVKQPTASAVLSGIKIEGAMGLINRIADAEQWSSDRKLELQRVFSHLGEINKLRNDLLHFGAFWEAEKDEWAISNEGFIHTPDKFRRRIVPRRTWEAAFGDLVTIFDALRAIAWPDELSSRDLEIYKEGRAHAWRYKPQRQVARGRKSQRTPRKR